MKYDRARVVKITLYDTVMMNVFVQTHRLCGQSESKRKLDSK